MADLPRTRDSLAHDLRNLGIDAGDVVLVHSSLRSLGWVCGGAVAVVQALLDTLGPDGTLVVPTQSMGNSDPKYWSRPPVPESWWPVIRATMPAFDPRITPAEKLGVVPETVRTWPGAVRSNHPHTSFAALGSRARALMAEHRLDSQLGEDSPLAALERVGAKVLLLGVGFDSCTAFHLAEYRVENPVRIEYGCAMLDDQGNRVWRTYVDVDTNSDRFGELGESYLETGTVTTGRVGDATCRLFPVDEAVAHAVGWLRRHEAAVTG
jgi:aminoglycoside 3-N-acetyltransferase